MNRTEHTIQKPLIKFLAGSVLKVRTAITATKNKVS